MTTVETNLRPLKPSRKPLRPGDVFTMKLPDDRYLFGRVIRTDARIGPMEGVILVYVYDSVTAEMDPPVQDLTRDRLLIPPVLINRLPWSRGLFQTVNHAALSPDDVLDQHCFYSPIHNRYFDEEDNELPGPIEPVGDSGLQSYRTLDDRISDALGIARVPEAP